MTTSRKIIAFSAAAMIGVGLLLTRNFSLTPSAPDESMARLEPSAAIPPAAAHRLIQGTVQKRLAERTQPTTTPDLRTTELWNSILEALNSGNEIDRDNVLTNLIPALLDRDPQAAARLIATVKPEDGREELFRRLAQEWAVKDPAAALSWAEQLSDFNEQRSVLADVVARMAESNPADAMSAAERHQLGQANSGFLPNLAGTWAEKDLAGALAWAKLQSASEQRDQILARLAMIESKTAPVEAANRVLRDIQPGAAQNEAVMSVLNQWASSDFDSAEAWVAQFPDGPLRERALAELNGIQAYHLVADSSGVNAAQSGPTFP